MDAGQIQEVRRFNRLLTQRVGALQDSYLKRGRPLGEARILFEIAGGGADIRTLRERLGLDSGYLSRMLKSLTAQGLVTSGELDGDARRKQINLTPKGRREMAAYDTLSDDLAKSFLAPLAAAQRNRLIAAMHEVETLLAAGTVEIRVEPPASDAARRCLQHYFRELEERFEVGFDPSRSNSASEQEMTPPAGYFVVAWLAGEPVGCGALKIGDGNIGEIKRMWTASSARGLGIARRVLRLLENKARQAGIVTLRLETNRTLREAQGLYRSEGYVEVEPFNHEPYAHHWFEKQI